MLLQARRDSCADCLPSRRGRCDNLKSPSVVQKDANPPEQSSADPVQGEVAANEAGNVRASPMTRVVLSVSLLLRPCLTRNSSGERLMVGASMRPWARLMMKFYNGSGMYLAYHQGNVAKHSSRNEPGYGWSMLKGLAWSVSP